MKQLRPYQETIVAELKEKLSQGYPCVLGMCTGSGKTFTTYALIEQLVKANPNFRVLVLAHNQTVLRKNFQREDYLKSFELKTKSQLSSQEYRKSNIIVTIPATIYKEIAHLGRFDMIVTDEAHENFFAEMDQAIIKAYPKAMILCLTATHAGFTGEFNGKSWHKSLFSIMEGFDAGVLANPNIEIVATNWDYLDEDFNDTDELGGSYKFDDAHFLNACEKVDFRLKSYSGTNSKLYNALQSLPTVKQSYPKTLISCHSRVMADYVYAYFKERMDTGVVLSYSGEGGDVDSSALDRFQQDDTCRMAVVVRRGVLGFDCPELEFAIDLTGSRNVERTLQFCGRIMRKADKDIDKIYLKIVPEREIYYTGALMACVIALFHKENNANWTGKAKLMEKIIRRESDRGESDPDRIASGSSATVIPSFIFQWSEYRDAFEQLKHQGDKPLQGISFTSLKRVKMALIGKDPFAKKQWLLNYYKENKCLPKYGTKEQKDHERYGNHSHSSYDPEYVKELKKLGWINHSTCVKNKKQWLLNYYKENNFLPKGDTVEFRNHQNYSLLKSKSYDPEYVKELQMLGWVGSNDRVTSKKQWLLNYYKENKCLPKKGTKEYQNHSSYSGVTNDTYDPEYVKELEKLGWIRKLYNPDGKKQWLLNYYKENKCLPKFGTKEYTHHQSYTSPSSSSYDPEYVKELKKLGWISLKTANKNKKQWLLNYYKENKCLPKKGTKEYGNHYTYSHPNENSYDPEYVKELKKLGWIYQEVKVFQ